MRNIFHPAGIALISLLILILPVSCNRQGQNLKADKNNAGLKLPEGFGAFVVYDNVGQARHLTVNKNGDVFVKLNHPEDGIGILMLSDTNSDGRIDTKYGFGNYGGTGIEIKDNYLYASSNSAVYRYLLNDDQRVNNNPEGEILISGLVERRQHNSKSLALDNNGNIYVNIGAYSNNCQEEDRTKGSPGMMPCPILDSAGGIWRFSIKNLNQTQKNGIRYATGLRNVVGLDWNSQTNQLYVMQHGRDMLHDLYPELFDVKTSAELPSEAMYAINEGEDAGWPYYYYDQLQKKNILAPEYGGDGKKGGAEGIIDPVVAFPGHIAPNDMLFYTGDMFPERYKNGAFIAFHGSWNRAPELQKGFNVAFVPFKDGKPTGEWEIFADGFAGREKVESPGDAKHRPCGLAQGPDGSLYIADSAGGTIFRIFYKK